MEYGNSALDCLQAYIDSLVETGRMDDTRLGRHFFTEYKTNIILGAKDQAQQQEATAEPPRKRRRSAEGSNNPVPSKNTPLGSISLYNCTLSKDTVQSMVESGIGPHLAVLDFTGVHGLHDDVLEPLLPHCVNLKRLSLKNCRCLTVKTLRQVAQYQTGLESLDVGGSFNLSTSDVLEVLPMLTKLEEVHVSGLGWMDADLEELVSMRAWKAMSLNFSLKLSQAALRTSLMKVADSLTSLALAFCENVVDNTLLGMLGRNLPNLSYMDVRGNAGLTTLTGWYDGRASANLPAQPLLVLGRYSGLSASNVDDTKRIHPHFAQDLQVILDGGGMGRAILRGSPSLGLSPVRDQNCSNAY